MRDPGDPGAQPGGGGAQAPDSALIGWVTEPGGARRVCPRCFGRGFIRTAEVCAALAGASITITHLQAWDGDWLGRGSTGDATSLWRLLMTVCAARRR